VIYLLIFVVVMVMLSTLTTLRPSSRQKQQVLFRRHANQCGLHVELVADALSKHKGGAPTAVRYLLPWTAKNLRHGDKRHWLLVRGSRGATSPWQGWCWFQQSAPNEIHEAITGALDIIPENVNALCSNSFGLGAYWPECGEMLEIEDIAKALRIISRNNSQT